MARITKCKVCKEVLRYAEDSNPYNTVNFTYDVPEEHVCTPKYEKKPSGRGRLSFGNKMV